MVNRPGGSGVALFGRGESPESLIISRRVKMRAYTIAAEVSPHRAGGGREGRGR